MSNKQWTKNINHSQFSLVQLALGSWHNFWALLWMVWTINIIFMNASKWLKFPFSSMDLLDPAGSFLVRIYDPSGSHVKSIHRIYDLSGSPEKMQTQIYDLMDLSTKWRVWIYDPIRSQIQIHGIRSWDPFSGSTSMSVYYSHCFICEWEPRKTIGNMAALAPTHASPTS